MINITHGLNTKTALGHLIFLANKSVVTVSKDLKITPQQFTDWIKHRRPIPAERLVQLEKYFDIPANILVDNKRYAKRLSVLDGIELEILVAKNKLKNSNIERQKDLEYCIEQLEQDRQKQIRITRLAVLLDKNDKQIMSKIDQFLNGIEEEK